MRDWRSDMLEDSHYSHYALLIIHYSLHIYQLYDMRNLYIV